MSDDFNSSLNFNDLSEGDDDPDLPLLQEFHGRWEAVETDEKRNAILQEYCDKYPRLAKRFQLLPEVIRIVHGAKDEDPARLGPYRIIRTLAIGGMGKVFEAEDEELHRTVAVKTIHLGRAADPKLLGRFEYEREALARLHHTHIVPIYSSGEDDGLLYFAMPLIRGPSLADLVATISRWPAGSGDAAQATSWKEILGRATTDATWHRSVRRLNVLSDGVSSPAPSSRSVPESTDTAAVQPPLTEEYFRHIAEIIAVVAEALHSTHEAGVLHFDVKPSNILIERVSGEAIAGVHPWVIDFGLAEAGQGATDGLAPGEHGSSRRTRGFGTRGFMAPEMIRLRENSDGTPPPPVEGRAPLGRQTDIWSLGVTLYQLLTLHMPFADDTAVLDPNAGLRGPREHVLHLPRELEAVVLKALEKRQEDRYATAAALAEDLRRWLAGFPTEAGGAGRLERTVMWARRRPAAAFAAGMTAAFLLVASLGAVQVYQHDIERERAETDKVRAEAQAVQRTLDLLTIQRLRQPTRQMVWFASAWERLRSFRGGAQSPDPQLQGQAAATMEGIDAQVVKTMPGPAQVVEFDPRSERLLLFRMGEPEKGKPWSRTTLWDRTTDRTLVERDLGQGVLAFRPDGTPLQLSWVRDEPPKPRNSTKLRLFNVTSGGILGEYRSPLEGLSDFHAIALSRDGSHLAAVAIPVRRVGDKLVPDGDDTTITVWDAASDKPTHTLKHKATQDLALSPDGRLLAAWDREGETTVWTLPDGRLLSRFRVGRCPVSSLAFGRDPIWHDGEKASGPSWLLAVGESDGLITIWDLRTGRRRSVCRGTSYEVPALDFSADGALLVSAGRGAAKLWDVANGTCLLDLTMGNILNAVTFAPDGRHLVVSRAPGFGAKAGVDLVELELGRGIRTLYGLTGVIERTMFSPDGKLVAASSHEWEIGIWEWPSGRLRCVLPSPVGWFADNLGMAFDADGRRFACSVGREARLWDLGTERMIGRWTLPEGLLDSLAFPSRDRLLLIRQETRSGLEGPFSQFHPREYPRVVRIYDLLGANPTKAFHEITEFAWYVGGIDVTPDGAQFFVLGTGIDEGKLVRRFHVYDTPTGELKRPQPLPLSTDAGGFFHFDPGGKVLAVNLDQAPPRFSLFDLPGMAYRGSIDWPMECLNPGATRWLAVLGPSDTQPRRHVLYDRKDGKPFLQIDRDVLTGGMRCHGFSPDDRYLMSGNCDGTVSICDLIEVNRRLSKLRLGW